MKSSYLATSKADRLLLLVLVEQFRTEPILRATDFFGYGPKRDLDMLQLLSGDVRRRVSQNLL